MNGRRIGLAGAMLGLVALASTPGAPADAARWRPSIPLSPRTSGLLEPAIGFSSSGSGLAVWEAVSPGAPRASQLLTAERDPRRHWSQARAAGPTLVGTYVSRAVARRRAEQLLQTPIPGGAPSGTDPVTLNLVETGGSGAQSTAEVDPGHPVESFSGALGASRGGRLVLAWTRAERRDRGVYVRMGAAGGVLEPIDRVSSAGLALAAGIDERGDVVVVWAEEDGRIKARVRRAGDDLGPRQDLGDFETEYFDASAGFGEASVAMGPSGQVALVWTFDTLRETDEGTGEPLFQDFFAAAAPRGTFGPARHLERSTYTDDTSVEALVTTRGVPVVAWGGGGAKYSVASGSRFPRGRELASRGDDLASTTGPRGTAALIWLSGTVESSSALRSALFSPRSRRFGRVERLRAGGRRARDPAVAFDPRKGLPTAVWVATDSGGETVRASIRR